MKYTVNIIPFWTGTAPPGNKAWRENVDLIIDSTDFIGKYYIACVYVQVPLLRG